MQLSGAVLIVGGSVGGGVALGTHGPSPPLGPISFIFVQFSAKIVPNNGLPQLSGVDAPIPFPVGNPGSGTKTTLDREKKLVLGSGG